MASILKVNTIQDTDGNNIINENANVITIGAAGDTITVPAGATVSGFTSAGIDDNATSTAITIDSSERVGIGITSPLDQLSVLSSGIGRVRFAPASGSVSNLLLSGLTTGDSGFQFNSNQLNMFTYGDIAFFPSTSNISGSYPNGEVMRIRNNGNVGIGTSSPDELLSLEKSNAPKIQYKDTSGGTDAKVWRTMGLDSDYRVETRSDNLSNGQLAYAVTRSGYVVNEHKFFTSDSERMRIDSSGNLLVGTTSVQGGTAKSLQIADSSSARLLLQNTGGGRTHGFFAGTDGKLGLYDYTASAQRLAIDTSGNVGIGTTSPTGKLNISTASGAGGASSINTLFGANVSPTAAGMYVGFNDSDATATLGVYYASSPYPVINITRSDRTIKFMNDATERMGIDSSGHVTKPLQPAVHAYLNTTQSNIPTGFTTVQLNAEIYDVNSDFNTSTYTFTAPVTGKYLVTMNLVMTDVDTAFQWIYLVGVSSNRNYYLNQIDPRMLASDGTWTWVGSSLVDMDANDTFIMRTRCSAHGAAQMDIAGGTANATETTMTMTLLS